LDVGEPKVHGEPVKVPEPFVVKPTVPVGAVAPVLAVSVTVAVHVADDPTSTGEGEHDTTVLVGSNPGVTLCITWLGWTLVMTPPSPARAEPVAP